MKQLIKIVIGVAMAVIAWHVSAQTKSDEKMDQDIEVAENVLSTLFKQQFSNKRMVWGFDIEGSYMPGYGVTFRMPTHNLNIWNWGNVEAPGVVIYDMRDEDKARNERTRNTPKPKVAGKDRDSLMIEAGKRFVEVSKNFLADYGDVISGLKAEERIVITNRAEEFSPWDLGDKKRSLISVEAKRDDIQQLKQGKMSRDQFMSKLKILNTESAEALDPDLEVFSSMFDRLYREDLSRTYYTQGEVNYERLKDFGVIYYMRVYSSSDENDGHIQMPTQRKSDLTRAERDKIVKDLYPQFEKELIENVTEYGRTLRSLKDNEQVIFNVRLTRCTGCGIPAAIELAVPYASLKDYGTGKTTREATIAKVTVKKIGIQ